MLGSPHVESGQELLARLAPRPRLTSVLSQLWHPAHPQPGDVIEISGPAGCGKTQLLLECVAAALSCDATSGVVVLDCERHLSVRRLLPLLQRHLGSAAAAGSATARLQLLCPTSSHQTLVSLEALHSRLGERAGTVLLALDSLSTFYWADRHGLSLVGERSDARYRDLGAKLARLAAERRLVVVATRGELSATAGSTWDFMGAEWAAAVTRTVRLSPETQQEHDGGPVLARADAAHQTWQRRFEVRDDGVHWL